MWLHMSPNMHSHEAFGVFIFGGPQRVLWCLWPIERKTRRTCDAIQQGQMLREPLKTVALCYYSCVRTCMHIYIYMLDYANAGHASDGNAVFFFCVSVNFFSHSHRRYGLSDTVDEKFNLVIRYQIDYINY